MEIENEKWDDVIAGHSNNPSGEMEFLKLVENEITNGNSVFLIDDTGKHVYRLEFNINTQKFTKNNLNS